MRWLGPTAQLQGISSYLASTRYFSQGNATMFIDAHASAVWPAANRAIYIPFELDRAMLVTQMYCQNGATTAGNVDVGIYAGDGTRRVSSGSTAQSGTNAVQTFDITDTWLGPGVYYMALASDSGSATFFRLAHGAPNDWLVWGGLQQAAAFPLPATATFAVNTTIYLPAFGLTGQAVI